jgi:hypothetical protein
MQHHRRSSLAVIPARRQKLSPGREPHRRDYLPPRERVTPLSFRTEDGTHASRFSTWIAAERRASVDTPDEECRYAGHPSALFAGFGHTELVDAFRLVIEDAGLFWPRSGVIYVNGRRLYDLACGAASEPDPEWIAPPPAVVLPPSQQLLGGEDVWEDPRASFFEEGRVAVGACGCSFPGCDSLLVKIDVGDDEVVWHGFRRHNRPSVTYVGLGPFRFSRQAYEAALRAASSEAE